jgi:hypothetical protein
VCPRVVDDTASLLGRPRSLADVEGRGWTGGVTATRAGLSSPGGTRACLSGVAVTWPQVARIQPVCCSSLCTSATASCSSLCSVVTLPLWLQAARGLGGLAVLMTARVEQLAIDLATQATSATPELKKGYLIALQGVLGNAAAKMTPAAMLTVGAALRALVPKIGDEEELQVRLLCVPLVVLPTTPIGSMFVSRMPPQMIHHRVHLSVQRVCPCSSSQLCQCASIHCSTLPCTRRASSLCLERTDICCRLRGSIQRG